MDTSFVNVIAYIDDIEAFMPHFVLYRRGFGNPYLVGYGDYCQSERNSKLTDCYCTACRTRFEDGIRKPKEYKHLEIGTCANCGAPVEFRQMNRGRSTFYYAKNFAVFEKLADRVRIECIIAYMKFADDELQPEIDCYTVTRYELSPGKAVQYWCSYDAALKNYVWKPKKSRAREPNYARGFCWRDSNYTLINQEAVESSFLRYLFKDEQLPSMYITWLCRYAEHPQLEYLINGGVPQIAMDYIYHGMKVRLNWRSNNMKKILQLSKPELEYFVKLEGRGYAGYINFRKSFFCGRTPEETVKYYDEFGKSWNYVEEIEEITKLPRKKIMDYALRKKNQQGTAFFLICYRDYLRECVMLEYDITSTAITMPKDIFLAHETTSKLISEINDEKINFILKKNDSKRQDLEAVDMELGLILRLPYSVKEISDEGAALNHCVGGYAQRHAEGKLTIMFLRTLGHKSEPFYTMEVSNELEIVQCRGYKNNQAGNPKPYEIELFEKRYSEYLERVKKQRLKEHRKKQQHEFRRNARRKAQKAC